MPFNQCTIPKRKDRLPHSTCLPLKLQLSFSLTLFCLHSFAQNAKTDSVYFNPLQSVYRQYAQRIGGSLALYNGAEYEGAYPRVTGTAFWNNNDFQKGTVSYGGVVYYDVRMAYDLVRNEVVIKGFQDLSLQLEKEKVNGFVLAGHKFVHLRDTESKNALPDDFYELLYDGDVRVYAKRSKRIVQSFRAEGLDTIVSNTVYFLHKDNSYASINGANDLLALFGNDKASVKAYWKQAGLNFKKDPEVFITQTLEHWAQTKK